MAAPARTALTKHLPLWPLQALFTHSPWAPCLHHQQTFSSTASPLHSPHGDTPAQTAAAAPLHDPHPEITKHVIYKGRWILPARFLVRGKVFQLMGMLGIASVAATMKLDEASTADLLALAGLAGGVVAASTSLWYYSRRYVGEMSLLLPHRTHVRFSSLDFWGNREDNDVPIDAIEAPLKGVRRKEAERFLAQLLFPLRVPGDRQYYLSVRAGNILDEEVFYNILTGRPLH